MKIVVIGATGNVGQELLSILSSDDDIIITQINALASNHSIGAQVSFGNVNLTLQDIENYDFNNTDLAFFCTNDEITAKFAPVAIEAGCTVIDHSSYYRTSPGVPLIVPEVNGDIIYSNRHKLIANPNCIAIQLAVAINPLLQLSEIKRMVVSTYQSVSGAGRDAMNELFSQSKARFMLNDVDPKIFPKTIAFNCIPQIGNFNDFGESQEEEKIIYELNKILNRSINISVTAVRVPVFVCHATSVNITFENDVHIEEIKEILAEAPGVLFVDRESEIEYVTHLDCVGDDAVYIARLRADKTMTNSFNMWTVTDNIRKGAALNATQIATILHNMHEYH